MNKFSSRKPFLSLAIPVYNQVSTIQATVNSALEALSGEADVEIVISENHSTDGTAEALMPFAGRVKIVRPPSHLRMVDNWNFVVGCCSGNWVGMLSGDDKILPGYVSSIRRIVSKRDSAVFAYGGWRNVSASTGIASRRTVMSMPLVSHPKSTVRSLLGGPKASFASYCFLKTAFEEVGGFPSEYNLIQDWILQFKLAFIGDFVKSNEIIAEYLVDQNREKLSFQRAPLMLRDLVNFCCNDIWSSVDLGVPKSAILNVCEFRASYCENLLNRFPDWRDQGNAVLSPLYELIGREMVAINRSKHRKSYLKSLKFFVRKLIQIFF